MISGNVGGILCCSDIFEYLLLVKLVNYATVAAVAYFPSGTFKRSSHLNNFGANSVIRLWKHVQKIMITIDPWILSCFMRITRLRKLQARVVGSPQNRGNRTIHTSGWIATRKRRGSGERINGFGSVIVLYPSTDKEIGGVPCFFLEMTWRSTVPAYSPSAYSISNFLGAREKIEHNLPSCLRSSCQFSTSLQ